MSDDMLTGGTDIADTTPDNTPLDQDAYGATISYSPNQGNSGGFIYDDGRMIGQVVNNFPPSSGFQIHTYGNARDTDMGSVLDSFDFSMDDVRMPWSSPESLQENSGIIGTPDMDVQYWQPQTTNFTCAVQAQRGIIEAFTGEHVSEAQLVYEATANGWLTDRGMSPLDAGSLLELHGIDCHSKSGATIEDLMSELAQGHKIIVGVDSGEIWRDDFPLEDFFGQSADHAIWVTGVDMTDPAHPKVIINDSGDAANGAGKAYDLALFKDAWQDSGFFYVATDDAPSDMSFAAGRGFDTTAGEFPELVGYFENLYSDFREHLQDRINDPVQITPSEAPTVFTDASIRAFIENLPNSPMASLNDSTTDTLFRII